jgi:hypothetical protein
MSHEENASDHIPDKKLREIAARSLGQTAYIVLTSIFTATEAAHFQECGKCIDVLASIT